MRLGLALDIVAARGAGFEPLLDLDFTTMQSGVMSASAWSALTRGGIIVRAGTNATVRSSATVDTNANADEARLYYDGADRGLLVEPAASNIAPHATDLRDSAGWTLGQTAGVQYAHAAPNGDANVTRFQMGGASQYTNYHSTGQQTSKAVAYQFWYKLTPSAAAGICQAYCGPQFPGGYRDFTPSTDWQLFVDRQGVQTGVFQLTPSDFSAGPRSGGGATRDFLATLAQIELTRYPTSRIRKTAVAGSGDRAGCRYAWPTASCIRNGRLSFFTRILCRAAKSWLAAGNLTIAYGAGGVFHAYIDQATGRFRATTNGMTDYGDDNEVIDFGDAQYLDVICESGGTQYGSKYLYRLGDGTGQFIPLANSGGVPRGNIVAAHVDFWNSAGTLQIPSLPQNLLVW